jgi:hypothetical protein
MRITIFMACNLSLWMRLVSLVSCRPKNMEGARRYQPCSAWWRTAGLVGDVLLHCSCILASHLWTFASSTQQFPCLPRGIPLRAALGCTARALRAPCAESLSQHPCRSTFGLFPGLIRPAYVRERCGHHGWVCTTPQGQAWRALCSSSLGGPAVQLGQLLGSQGAHLSPPAPSRSLGC